ncbi:ran GTPase activating protein 1 [Dothidotthia symphoricarpi CBS 119687]|uniref:Ran GTPase activating protein 1 n=1 Tax=Dothidotthia symphoricarpi CBS 119687 TaxID=1392245 RepID=A0A6A6AKW6_9PLEO|nr:ran GTPase activating protein 1 [Dothidotthia symphoricarpi CBS 119687]KAF2132599.1 ran GTPase activating protein 1 [Dothidotthia symphoricarpi CBS 119687]
MILKVFSIEGKGLKLDTAEDIQPHIKSLHDGIEEVRILGNTLGIGASEALAKALEGRKALKVANLADIFTSRLLSEIPPALSHLLTSLLTCPNLHTVDLSDNAFGLNTVAPLVDFLSQHTPLRYLFLNNNGLGPAAGVLVADALTTLAAKKEAARKEGKDVPDLELVICGRNRLENGSMAAWAKAYAANNGVKTIKMTQNGIRQEGITHLLTNGISNLSKLETLDLQDNTFTAMGAKALSTVVGRWPELRELGVGDCLLSGRGGVALAAALQKGNNKKIEVLRLQFNEINAKGVEGLASASASKLPALRRVELNGNKFDEEDASISKLRDILDGRKDESGEHEDDEEYWGLDELDELESDEEDEEEESDEEGKRGSDDDEEGVEVEERAARQIAEDQRTEESDVPQDKSKKVDDLADQLAKAEIK